MSEPPRPGGSSHKTIFNSKNKWYWIGGGVGALALVYYFHKQSQNASAASAPASGASGTDTSGTDTTGTDTGYGYDTSYPSDYYGDTGTGYSGASLGGYYDPSTGSYISGGYYPPTQVVTAPSTNAQWTQQAIAYLTQQGYDGTTVAAALGAYLLGMGLTSDQMQIVQAAIATEGPPPTSVPAPHVNPPTGQGGGLTGGSTPKQLATPVLVLDHVNAPAKRAALRWNAIPAVDHYQLNIGIPGASHVYANIPGSDTLASVTKSGPYHIYAVPPANSGVLMSHYSNTVVVPAL